MLADLLPPSRPRVITPELILDETAKMFGLTVEDLCGKSRRRPLVTARQIGMYVFRELTDFSYPRIAEQFGGRDHTTVMHAVEKIKQLMNERHATFDQVNELIAPDQARHRWMTAVDTWGQPAPIGDDHAARHAERATAWGRRWTNGGTSHSHPDRLRTGSCPQSTGPTTTTTRMTYADL